MKVNASTHGNVCFEDLGRDNQGCWGLGHESPGGAFGCIADRHGRSQADQLYDCCPSPAVKACRLNAALTSCVTQLNL